MRVRIECAPRLTISVLREGFEGGQHFSFGMTVCQIARCYRSWLKSIIIPTSTPHSLPSGPDCWEGNSGSEPGAIEESHLHQRTGRDSKAVLLRVKWESETFISEREKKLKRGLDQCSKAFRTLKVFWTLKEPLLMNSKRSNCKSKRICHLESHHAELTC